MEALHDFNEWILPWAEDELAGIVADAKHDQDREYWFIDSDVMARRAGSDTVTPFSDEELNEHFADIAARAEYEASYGDL